MSVADRIRRFAVGLPALLVAVACAAQDTTPVDDARALLEQGRYADAESAARLVVASSETRHGLDALEVADALDVLVEALWRGGKANVPETRTLAERALSIKRELLGREDVGTTNSLNNLAVVSFMLGDYDRALPAWESVLAIRERALDANHPDVAQAANNLANLLQTLGDYDRARSLYERAVAIRETAFGPEHALVAQSLNNLAVLLDATGDWAGALDHAERALAIREKVHGPEHPRVARSLTNLCKLLWNLGDRTTARAHCDRAVQILEAAFGPDHPAVAATLNNLAELLRDDEKYDEARRLYERAIVITESARGEDHRSVANYLNNLALALDGAGDTAGARRALERAVAIRESALGPSHFELGESLANLAALDADDGKLERAEELYRRAIEIFEASLGAAHPLTAGSQGRLAVQRARQGDLPVALDLALDAETVARDHLRLTGRALAEEQALRYAAVRTGGLDLALGLASRMEPAARRRVLDAVVRSRAVVLDAMAARQRAARRTSSPEVAHLAQNLAASRARLANLTVRGPGRMDAATYRRLLDEARTDKELAERALAAASAEFAEELESARIGLAEVDARLPADTALVAFVLHDRIDLETGAGRGESATAAVPAYTALVLAPPLPAPGARRTVSVIPIGAAARIDRLVSDWKREAAVGAFRAGRSVEDALAAYRTPGRALRRAVWDPVAQQLGKATRVLVVPDGALNLVSLASLPTDGERFLVEHGPDVHYLSAERDLVRRPVERAGHGLLVLGGPAYGRPGGTGNAVATPRSGETSKTRAVRSWRSSFDSLRFDPLPAAQREATEIATLWALAADPDGGPDATLHHLHGATATETAFKRRAVGRRILHLATHGFFLGGDWNPVGGTRALKLVADSDPGPAPAFELSPLLLSGLAFAGANEKRELGAAEDDGVLTAEEIASLDLGGVEWTVLSACDTGLGEIRAGEGVFGLRRAMHIAGVRTLIMSLWPVDDDATRQWMRELYRARLLDGLDTAASVRRAGRSVLEQRREAGESEHPFFWAAFLAAGDWR